MDAGPADRVGQRAVGDGDIVWSVYEACGFGYTLREQCAQLYQLRAELTMEVEARVAGDPFPKELG